MRELESPLIAIRLGRMICLAALILSSSQACLSKRGTVERREKPATDSRLAVGNLDAQIQEHEKAHARTPERLQFIATLVGFLETRAQYSGRLSDYDRALELAQEAVERAPEDGSSFVLRARVRSALHQFSAALADLNRASELGADELAEPLRTAIMQAQGRLPEALERWRTLARSSPQISIQGSLAVAEGESGNRVEAEQLFSVAIRSYRDVSPFPLAWIEFQQGLMWERAAELGKARIHYESARRYLPQYAPATGHLAMLLSLRGDAAKAAELLRPLADLSEDPEYAAQLATVLVQLGDFKGAARFRDSAAERYDLLLGRHPEAFADHAARFWLGIDPKKALGLATENLANRKTQDAFDLAISAALAAKDSSAACELAEGATRLPRPAPRIDFLVRRAFQSCGHPDLTSDNERASPVVR